MYPEASENYEMARRFVFVTLAVALMRAPLCSASFTPDEVAVRSASSAVMLASRIASISASYATSHLSTEQQLKIELSNLHAGPLSEILATPLSKLVTVPSGELLLSAPGSFSLDDRFIGSFVEVENWGPVNARYGFNDRAIFDVPIRELLETAFA